MLLKHCGITLNSTQLPKHSLTATLANLMQIITLQIQYEEHPWYPEYTIYVTSLRRIFILKLRLPSQTSLLFLQPV